MLRRFVARRRPPGDGPPGDGPPGDGPPPGWGRDRRRGRGQRGSGMVTALVLMFTFTAGGVIWLSRDVNRRVSNQSAAQAIAFQSARSGAQQIELGTLRTALDGDVEVDVEGAEQRAAAVAERLFAEYDLDGTVVSTEVADGLVTVRVTVHDPAGDVTGVGSARPETGG